MCKMCEQYEHVCLNCGAVKHPDWNGKVFPWVCERRKLKELVETSDSESFVWIMLFRGVAVKVGCGTLKKLYNETLPNPRYCRFDTTIIYYMKDKWDRNEFATLLCGLIGDGLLNRQGWVNYTYCRVGDLVMPPDKCNPYDAFGDADFYIGDMPYWDIRKLALIGIKRRRMVL